MERPFVPFREEPGRLFRRAAAGAQQAPDLGDDLHVGVFDAVMDGLHEMARAVGAEPRRAGLVLVARGDGLGDRPEPLPGSLASPDHDRGAMARWPRFVRARRRRAHADRSPSASLARKLRLPAVAGVVE